MIRTTLAAAAVTLGALSGAPAMAALSGYYDSAVQIAAIFESEELGNVLRQAPVEEMEFKGQGRDENTLIWEVSSRDCDVRVTLKATPPSMPGMTTYAVESVGRCED